VSSDSQTYESGIRNVWQKWGVNRKAKANGKFLAELAIVVGTILANDCTTNRILHLSEIIRKNIQTIASSANGTVTVS